MDSNLIDPKAIAQTCSRKHIQSVIENLVDIIKAQEHLADKILFLNPRCPLDWRRDVDKSTITCI